MVGDSVVCVGGPRQGSSKFCTIVDVSKTKKTLIVKDEEGAEFRKQF